MSERLDRDSYALIIMAITILVGKKLFESAACSEKLSLNAARPTFGEGGARSAFVGVSGTEAAAYQDTASHEAERDDGPDDSPACRASTVAFGEDRGVRFVYLAKDEVVELWSQSRQR